MEHFAFPGNIDFVPDDQRIACTFHERLIHRPCLRSVASHADVLTGSSRDHSSPTNDVRGVGTRDELLRTFAWEAIRSVNHEQFPMQMTQNNKHNKWLEILAGKDFPPKLIWRTPTEIHRDQESLTKQSICVEYSLLYKKHLSFAGAHSQMNTTLFRNRPGET